MLDCGFVGGDDVGDDTVVEEDDDEEEEADELVGEGEGDGGGAIEALSRASIAGSALTEPSVGTVIANGS